MSASEYAGWQAYYAEEPSGQERDNWHMSILASLFANSKRGRGKPPIKPHQFMWSTADKKRESQTKATLSKLRSMGKRK